MYSFAFHVFSINPLLKNLVTEAARIGFRIKIDVFFCFSCVFDQSIAQELGYRGSKNYFLPDALNAKF